MLRHSGAEYRNFQDILCLPKNANRIVICVTSERQELNLKIEHIIGTTGGALYSEALVVDGGITGPNASLRILRSRVGSYCVLAAFFLRGFSR